MPTNNNNSNSSNPTTTTTAKARTKARQPPVAERVAVGAPLVVPPTQPPATPPAAGAVPSVGAPPPATIPAVPSGFVPINAADLLGFRVLASEASAVPDAIAELQGFTSYSSVFGITAPDVGQLTQRLSVAQQWTMQLSQTAAWYKYAKSQQGLAWKDALELVDALKPAFDLASTANAALHSQYPALVRLLGARTVVAKRGAASRAKGKKVAAQTGASGSAGGAAATSAAPAAPAGDANGATPTPPPATRVVAAQG